MMAAAHAPALPLRRRTSTVLLLVSACLFGCDPVDETEAPEPGAAQERPRAERSARDEAAAEERAAEQARERAARETREADTEAEAVAADVAAGLVDAGPLGDAPLEANAVVADTAVPSAPEGSHDVYVRPVIHPDVIPNLRILRFALAEDVVDREPVMVSSSFRRDSGPMHVFVEVRNETGEDIQLFVGFRQASVPQRGAGVTLSIPPSPRYRTRARTNTLRSVGEWVCEIMDERQRVLVTQRFWITPGTTPSPAAEPAPAAE